MPDARESNWWQIVGAFKCGNSSEEIARLLEIPRSTVLRVLSNYRHRGTVSRKEGSGRPRKTNPRSNRLLVRLAKSHPFAPFFLRM